VDHLLLSGDDAALFVSDVHLCDDEPDSAAYFFSKLEEWLPAHTHLVILGDLFESWCGDDITDLVARKLITNLNTRSSDGLKIYIMRGNRDFLIDQKASNSNLQNLQLTVQTGATLLTDECLLTSFGAPWLLCHGDQLCTLDLSYQAFRKQSRSQEWQQAFLSQPRQTRLHQAKQMRAASRAHQMKSDERSLINKNDTNHNAAMYDVNADTVSSFMEQFQVAHMLHGHTHKPAVHQIGNNQERWVLSDWSANPERGDAISMSASGPVRLS
jgi:UDP-2,3-diacylglucosamine hydrolase